MSICDQSNVFLRFVLGVTAYWGDATSSTFTFPATLPKVGALFEAAPKGEAALPPLAADPNVDPAPPPKVDDPKAGLPPNAG